MILGLFTPIGNQVLRILYKSAVLSQSTKIKQAFLSFQISFHLICIVSLNMLYLSKIIKDQLKLEEFGIKGRNNFLQGRHLSLLYWALASL